MKLGKMIRKHKKLTCCYLINKEESDRFKYELEEVKEEYKDQEINLIENVVRGADGESLIIPKEHPFKRTEENIKERGAIELEYLCELKAIESRLDRMGYGEYIPDVSRSETILNKVKG